jgi:cardiolipin synthase (CMP-forming)
MRLSWIPNAICVVRILLVVPIVLALLRGRYELAFALVVAAGASDAADGFLAKRFNWRTRLGSLLDPAADKLLVTSVFVTLTYIGLVPLGVTLIVIARDIIIVGGVSAYQLLIGTVRGAPTRISKLNTACQLGFVVFTMTHAAYAWPPQVSLTVLGAAVVFTSIVSGLAYVLEWSKLAWRAKHSSAAT